MPEDGGVVSNRLIVLSLILLFREVSAVLYNGTFGSFRRIFVAGAILEMEAEVEVGIKEEEEVEKEEDVASLRVGRIAWKLLKLSEGMVIFWIASSV